MHNIFHFSSKTCTTFAKKTWISTKSHHHSLYVLLAILPWLFHDHPTYYYYGYIAGLQKMLWSTRWFQDVHGCNLHVSCSQGSAPWHGTVCEPGRLAAGPIRRRDDLPHVLMVRVEADVRHCNADLWHHWVFSGDDGEVSVTLYLRFICVVSLEKKS